MTMLISVNSLLLVTIALLGIGVVLALSPKPLALDGERWFKILIATLLRGAVDSENGDGDAWVEKVLRFVPYHPAGQFPEQKVVTPHSYALQAPPMEGEAALMEALKSIPTVEERIGRLYDEDPVGVSARLIDPYDLGKDYDPATYLGPSFSWDSVAEWGATDEAPIQSVLINRLGAQWILLGGRSDGLKIPPVLRALESELGSFSQYIPWEEGDIKARAESLVTQIRAMCKTSTEGFILVGEEAGVNLAIRVLVNALDLRDRVIAVVSLGGIIRGLPKEDGPLGSQVMTDYLEGCFTHACLDSELVSPTPYFSVQYLDRTQPSVGVSGLSLEAMRFPNPSYDPHTPDSIQCVDCGPLPVVEDLPLSLVARGLCLVVSLWIFSHQRT